MSVILLQNVSVVFSGLLLFYAIKIYRRSATVSFIPGPPNPSWLLGHIGLIRNATNVGDYEASWLREYGHVYRTAGVFSESVLNLADPQAVQNVLHTSGYRYPKSADVNYMTSLIFGPGIVSAVGHNHAKQRKLLNHAFSATQLQSYLKLFQDSANKLAEKIAENLNEEGRVVNVLSWTHKAALDIIGITGFRYHFGSVEGLDNDLGKQFGAVAPDAQLFPSSFEIVFSQGLLRHLPTYMIHLLSLIPSEAVAKYKSFRQIIDNKARELHLEQVDIAKRGGLDNEKDIINLLAISSLSDDRMDEAEVISQMVTFIMAGHDTTGDAIGWLLYELSQHPDDQSAIRAEIMNMRSTKPWTTSDYNALPLMNAAIKESLRRHPFVHTLMRVAEEDDVIPLGKPLTTRNGRVISEIAVKKGQAVEIPMYAYHSSPEVWGADAARWNPSRFLSEAEMKETSVGMYANLLTFSGGVRSCIGWRFAVMEIQTILVELLMSLEFSIPKDAPEVVHGAGLQAAFPILKGEWKKGTQMPLKIRSISPK